MFSEQRKNGLEHKLVSYYKEALHVLCLESGRSDIAQTTVPATVSVSMIGGFVFQLTVSFVRATCATRRMLHQRFGKKPLAPN